MPLNNEQCKTRPFLIGLNPVEVNYYPFIITFGKCSRSFNTLSEISGRICVRNKTKNVNLNTFNLITRANQSKKLIKHISCKCNCKFDGKKYIEIWNNYKCQCERKNSKRKMCTKKFMFRILLNVPGKMVNFQVVLLKIQ